MRLLVVDDDAVFREELGTLLSDWGHKVETVSLRGQGARSAGSQRVRRRSSRTSGCRG